MPLKLPFRLTRGATVVLFIVLAHVILAALFMGMRVRVELPQPGPVFATILAEPEKADPEEAAPSAASKPSSEVASSTASKPKQAR